VSARIRADRRVGLLLAGIVFLTFVAIGVTVALPAADPAVRSTKGERKLSALQIRGMKVYRNEGCWYCHTQYVRDTPVDAPYGKPLPPGAYAGQSPALLGTVRIGPDLTHVGSRYASASDLITLLSHRRPSSEMPSYAYLSPKAMKALAAYLLTLK
jgi:cbb3-type cytochrome c oxidase subunit II